MVIFCIKRLFFLLLGNGVGGSKREACLELIIDPTSDGPEWRLTVPPAITGEEAKAWEKTAALRRALSAPVARMRPNPKGISIH